MSQTAQGAPQGVWRVVWNNSGRMDEEEGEGQGRFARWLPAVFRPLQPAPGHPRPVHVELCEDCRVEVGYDVLRGHFPPLPTVV